MSKVELLYSDVDHPEAVVAMFMERLKEFGSFVILAENDDSILMWTNSTTPKDRLMYAESLRDHAVQAQGE